MNCRLVQTKLSQYLDQELSGREMIAIQHHCGSCDGCSKELEALREVKSILGSSYAADPLPGFESRLHAVVFSEAQSRRPVSQGFPLRGALVAAVAGAVLVIGVMRLIEPSRAGAAGAPSTESIDFATDQTVQGVLDPFGGQPIVTVSHGR